MNFPIELRHTASGLAKNFTTREEVAEFLAGQNPEEWEGWKPLNLPAAAVESTEVPAVAVASAKPARAKPAAKKTPAVKKKVAAKAKAKK